MQTYVRTEGTLLVLQDHAPRPLRQALRQGVKLTVVVVLEVLPILSEVQGYAGAALRRRVSYGRELSSSSMIPTSCL